MAVLGALFWIGRTMGPLFLIGSCAGWTSVGWTGLLTEGGDFTSLAVFFPKKLAKSMLFAGWLLFGGCCGGKLLALLKLFWGFWEEGGLTTFLFWFWFGFWTGGGLLIGALLLGGCGCGCCGGLLFGGCLGGSGFF